MSGQKPFLRSKTVINSILTFLIALYPLLLTGVNQGFNPLLMGEIVALITTTGLTIYGRFTAKSRLYTPAGFPGPSYIPLQRNR